MRLLVKEYINSLRERGELDIVLPDILSELGYKVISRPTRGSREYGVDIAAIGPDKESDENALYLLSVKSGNLGRVDWNTSGIQALRPSLEEIIDLYIPKKISKRYKHLKVYVVLCFGGDIQSNIREDVDAFVDKYTIEGELEFDEWNGDVITDKVVTGLLREKVFPPEFQSEFRKALAFVDEPEVCFDHFCRFIRSALDKPIKRKKDRLTLLRQFYLATWNVYVWCREEGNLDAAYRCSEFAALTSWDLSREHCDTKSGVSGELLRVCDRQFSLYRLIAVEYLEEHVNPCLGMRDGVAESVNSRSGLDVTLQIFEVLGRLAMHGMWLIWNRSHVEETEEFAEIHELEKVIQKVADDVCSLISDNKASLSPIRDDHAIEVMLVGLFLFLCFRHDELNSWVGQITQSCVFNHNTGRNYPCIYTQYNDLANHPKNTPDYVIEATEGSVLYPVLGVWLALLSNNVTLKFLGRHQQENMSHSNWQYWFPGEDSEQSIYSQNSEHGITVSRIDVSVGQEELLKDLVKIIDDCGDFNHLSANTKNLWPIILMCCRHYRRPVPMHFLYLKNPLKENLDAV